MVDFSKDVAMGRQKLVVFRSPLECPRFLTKGPDIEDVLCAVGQDLTVEPSMKARLPRDRPKAFM